MKFSLVPKFQAVLLKIDPQAIKMGQSGLQPGVALHFKAMVPNAQFLPMLHKGLLPFLYDKGGKPGSQIDAAPVSDLPSMTEPAMKMGRLKWSDEQPGSKLTIHRGTGVHANIVMKDGTVEKVDFAPKEGGAIEVRWRMYFTDVDAETMGAVGVLKKHELEIEVEAPTADTRQAKVPGTEETPEGALVKTAGKK